MEKVQKIPGTLAYGRYKLARIDYQRLGRRRTEREDQFVNKIKDTPKMFHYLISDKLNVKEHLL